MNTACWLCGTIVGTRLIKGVGPHHLPYWTCLVCEIRHQAALLERKLRGQTVNA